MTQEKLAVEAEEKIRLEEELQAQRKLDSKELAGETIRRELEERELSTAPEIAMIVRPRQRY